MAETDLKKLTKDELITLAEEQAARLAAAEEQAQAAAQAADQELKSQMVRIRIPRSRSNNAPVYVALNDYNAMIPRGVEVSVPKYVYLHLQECLDADEAAALKLDQMQEEFAARTRSYFG
nr:MAG TPA: hypothetical protein [Caudoviricetes sp.]